MSKISLQVDFTYPVFSFSDLEHLELLSAGALGHLPLDLIVNPLGVGEGAGSSAGEKTFMRLVEASEWLQLLQAVMQIAGAVTDLMDIQVILASDWSRPRSRDLASDWSSLVLILTSDSGKFSDAVS